MGSSARSSAVKINTHSMAILCVSKQGIVLQTTNTHETIQNHNEHQSNNVSLLGTAHLATKAGGGAPSWPTNMSSVRFVFFINIVLRGRVVVAVASPPARLTSILAKTLNPRLPARYCTLAISLRSDYLFVCLLLPCSWFVAVTVAGLTVKKHSGLPLW